MSSSSNPSSTVQKPNKSVGFVANAIKRKDSFFQLFVMTGILLLSLRSAGQKYRLHELQQDHYDLQEEDKALNHRINHIKTALLAEAAQEPSGHFASRLRILFGNDTN